MSTRKRPSRRKVGFPCRMGLVAVLLFACPAGLVPQPTPSETPTPLDRILGRYVEALGGREAVGRLRTRTIRGWIVTDLPTRDPPVYEVELVEIEARVPDRYLIAEYGPEGAWRHGFDGRSEWKESPEGVRLLEGDGRSRFAWLFHPRNALVLRDYFPEMRLRGEAVLEGRTVDVVDIDGDVSHALHFDRETGLLARLGYNRELEEYREVDGVLFPHRIRLSRKGGSSTYVFRSVEHDRRLAEGHFRAPIAPGASLPEQSVPTREASLIDQGTAPDSQPDDDTPAAESEDRSGPGRLLAELGTMVLVGFGLILLVILVFAVLGGLGD